MELEGLILDRYEPIGTAGEGGFGTVRIAWDPRIQRRVAIKTIRLTELDAARAALPGAQASADAQAYPDPDELSPADGEWAERGSVGTAQTAADQPFDDGFDQTWQEGQGSVDQQGQGDWGQQGQQGWSQQGQDQGGQGQQAHQSGHDQVTALAHMPGLDEARTAAMMADPRIVTVYDFEIRDRTAYLIMEFVDGITLTDLLNDYANYLTLDMVTAVFDSVAGALEVAHDSGVLHLDIKPDNILINAQGQVKVTDFGLATLADATGSGRTGGGTIGYMPPEQIRRESLDARTDEWALASVTYEMLTGSNPFRVPELADAEEAISESELVLPSLCWKNIDEQIDDVIFYALDPNREERYASVSDFAEEVDKFLGDAESGANQLKLVVEDALNVKKGEDEPAGQAAEDVEEAPGLDEEQRPERPSFTQRLLDVIDGPDDEGDFAESAGQTPSELAEIESERTRPRPPREPVATRIPEPVVKVCSHLFGAVGSGFVSALAFTNMEPLMTALGPGASYGVGVLVAIVAVLGAIRSHVGAIVSFCLLGIALVMCGHPVVGALLLVATVAWWYTVGHEGAASANAALLMPLSGGFGAGTVVPFFAGASMRPVQAVVTMVFGIMVAFIMAGFGTGSLLGWNVFANGDFARADVTSVIVDMFKQPATWATVAGWLVATVALSLLRLRESRALTIVGIAIALVAVLAGSLAFATPTPQLIVSSIIAAAVLIGALV